MLEEKQLDHQKIRTFIAVHVPDGVRGKIGEFQNRLKPFDCDIRWVRPESIHVTLKFLGDVRAEQIGEISESIRIAIESLSTFEVMVGGAGVFPDSRRPRVLWVGVEKGSEELALLALKIEDVCSNFNFKKEMRAFSAHLTIGRVRSPKGIASLVEAMQTIGFQGGSYSVGEVVVMKSNLQQTGAIYTPLHQIKLQG